MEWQCPPGRQVITFDLKALEKVNPQSHKQELKKEDRRKGGREERGGKRRDRKGERENKKEKDREKKKGPCARENPTRRTQSLSHDLKVTSRPDCEGHHVLKLLPPPWDVHHYLPWLLAPVFKNLTFQLLLRCFNPVSVSVFILIHGCIATLLAGHQITALYPTSPLTAHFHRGKSISEAVICNDVG